MRTRTPESLNGAALSMKALKNIEKLAFPNGAILTCKACGRTSEKTAEQMKAYVQKWPRCCSIPADVRPKY